MPLPLQDKNNPLYGLPIDSQCQTIVEWEGRGISPYQLFSLPRNYTQDQINKAYRQLARVHPDKNPGIEPADAAFKVVCAAKDYVEYGLKSSAEKYKARLTIINNPFYKVYGQRDFGRANLAPRATTQRTTRNENPYEEMNFFELLLKIAPHPYNTRPLPARLVEALKRYIINDPSLINKYQPMVMGAQTTRGQAGRSSTIGQFVAAYGDFDFLQWLIERGADPFLKTQDVHPNQSTSIISFAIFKGHIRFLRYLLQKKGPQVFYNESESGEISPRWEQLGNALSHKQLHVVPFLLEELGFNRHLHKQPLSSFHFCMRHIKSFLSNNGYGLATAHKKMVFEIASQLLKQAEADSLCCGIEELLDAVNKILELDRRFQDDSYRIAQDILTLISQQVGRLDIQADELGAIQTNVKGFPKPPDSGSRRKNCIDKLYNTALRHAHVGILEQLLAISKPLDLDETNRKRLLWESLSYCRTDGLHYHPDVATQREIEANFQQIVTSLFSLGCFATLEEKYTFEVYKKAWTKRYINYTLLHIACKAGWQELVLQLYPEKPAELPPPKVPEEGEGEERPTRKDREVPYNSNSGFPRRERLYRYSPLHIAIKKGLTSAAVGLINHGADTNLKAIVDKPSSWRCCFNFFGKRQHIEQTPLEMAIERHQPDVIRALQRVMLQNYITQREQEPEYLCRIIVFGYVLFELEGFNFCGLILGFGDSRTDKLERAHALRDLLDSGDTFDEAAFNRINVGAARGGRLGEIVQLSRYYLRTEPLTDANTQAI